MSKAYISWVDENLPNAQKVFDHFHVIKIMNDKLDKIRRRTAKEFDEEQKDLLKNQRFLFLRNVEDLEPDAKQLLDNLRKVFKELGGCQHDEGSFKKHLSRQKQLSKIGALLPDKLKSKNLLPWQKL
jgi:transposase